MEFKKQNKQRGEKKRQRQIKKQLIIENKLMVTRGVEGEVKEVMEIKACTCDEHWVMYRSAELLYCLL